MRNRYPIIRQEYIDDNYFNWLKIYPHRTCECYANAPMPITLYWTLSYDQSAGGLTRDMFCDDCITKKEKEDVDWALGFYAAPFKYYSKRLGKTIYIGKNTKN